MPVLLDFKAGEMFERFVSAYDMCDYHRVDAQGHRLGLRLA